MSTIYRSYLWTTALLPEKYSYASKVNADIGIIDLEDSVPLEHKEHARNLALTFLAQEHSFKYGLRINSLHTLEGISDILALANSQAKPHLIVLPKVEAPEEIAIANHLLTHIPKLQFCATIETPRGVANLYDIAQAGNNLQALIWGSADLSAALGVVPDWPGADHIRNQLVLAASNAGILALDTAEFDLANDKKLAEICTHIKTLGLVGKACVHPRQVAIVNQAFLPLEDELAEAQEMLNSHAATNAAITIVRGKMSGPPMRKMAQKRFLENY